MAKGNILVADMLQANRIEPLVDTREFRLGRALFGRGQIEAYPQSASRIDLKVRDASYRYTIGFAARDGEAIPTCNCEVGRNIEGRWCRHSVAAALALYNYLFRNPPVTWEQQVEAVVEARPQRPRSETADQILMFGLERSYGFWTAGVFLAGTKGLEARIVDAIAAGEKPEGFPPVGSTVKRVRTSFDPRRLVNPSPELLAAAAGILIVAKGYATERETANLLSRVLPVLGRGVVFITTVAAEVGQAVRISDQVAEASLELSESGNGDLTISPVLTLEGVTVPATAPHTEIILADPLWVHIGDTVARVSADGEALLSALDDDIVVPSDERAEFVETYLVPLAQKVPVTGTGVNWQTIVERPVPRIYLSQTEDAVTVSVRFGYGEYELQYAGASVSPGVRRKPGTAQLVQIVRDAEFEEKAYSAVLQQGLRRGQKPDELLMRARTNPIEFLMRGIPRLLAEGFEVYGEEQIKNTRVNRSRPRVTMHVGSGIDWFDVKLVVDFGGVTASLKEIRRVIRQREKFVKLADGTYGELPEDWLEHYRRLFVLGEVADEGVTLRKTQAVLLDEVLEAADPARIDAGLAEALSRLRGFEKVGSVAIPEGFRADLRPYQKAGYDWLHFLREFGFGGCLADDMGLGKTVQALALLLWLRQNPDADGVRRPGLVVVPRSLIVNWQREAQRFAPELQVHINADTTRVRDARKLADYDMVLTTYGTMLRDISLLSKMRFRYAILDEAQAIKNPEALVSKAARMLKADLRLTLTGTPIENSTLDLWSQFDFLNPGLLGTLEQFKSEFAGAIEKTQDQATAATLRKLVFPFILRRTKDQVAPELPPRTERIIVTEMDADQRALYNRYRDHFRGILLGMIDQGGIGRASMKILEGLLRLRQIANHPRLVEHESPIGSSKMEALIETLTTLQAEGHKVLVFSQFVQMLRLIRTELDQLGLTYEYLTGQTKDRQSVVDRFQNDPSIPFLLASLKAGGVGLNLTAASYVMHVDPWWNPAVEMQASDRTHRIGQDKPVFVYKFIVRDTVEDKVLMLQERKRGIVTQVISSDMAFFKSLSREDVNVLFD